MLVITSLIKGFTAVLSHQPVALPALGLVLTPTVQPNNSTRPKSSRWIQRMFPSSRCQCDSSTKAMSCHTDRVSSVHLHKLTDRATNSLLCTVVYIHQCSYVSLPQLLFHEYYIHTDISAPHCCALGFVYSIIYVNIFPLSTPSVFVSVPSIHPSN